MLGFRAFPQKFDFSNPNDRPRIRLRIHRLLSRLSGEEHPRVEVALGEALMNACRHGQHVRVKINRFGQRMVLRVKDDGPGFAGRAAVHSLMAAGLGGVFTDLMYSECGRGIPVMLAWADRVLYNKQGNEVLLIAGMCTASK